MHVAHRVAAVEARVGKRVDAHKVRQRAQHHAVAHRRGEIAHGHVAVLFEPPLQPRDKLRVAVARHRLERLFGRLLRQKALHVRVHDDEPHKVERRVDIAVRNVGRVKPVGVHTDRIAIRCVVLCGVSSNLRRGLCPRAHPALRKRLNASATFCTRPSRVLARLNCRTVSRFLAPHQCSAPTDFGVRHVPERDDEVDEKRAVCAH